MLVCACLPVPPLKTFHVYTMVNDGGLAAVSVAYSTQGLSVEFPLPDFSRRTKRKTTGIYGEKRGQTKKQSLWLHFKQTCHLGPMFSQRDEFPPSLRMLVYLDQSMD